MKTLRMFFVALLFGACAGNTFAQGTVVRFAIGEWSPYTSSSLPGQGMAAEIVTAACATVGLTAVYDFFPWKRAEANVAAGTHFGTFPYKELKERQSGYRFSGTLFSSRFGILMRKSSNRTAGFRYAGIEDLRSYSVGIVTGTDAIRIPLENVGVKVEAVASSDQNLKKLLAGRIDFYIDDKAVIHQELQKNFSPQTLHEVAFVETGFGERNDFKIMVSMRYPNSAALVERINDGLARIRDSGELERIMTKYGLSVVEADQRVRVAP